MRSGGWCGSVERPGVVVLVMVAAACSSAAGGAGPAVGGPADASAAGDAADAASGSLAAPTDPLHVAIDLGGAAFPAAIRKLGMNTNYQTVDPKDLTGTDTASSYGAAIVSGLVDTKLGPGDFPDDPGAIFRPDPLFYRDGGHIRTRTSENLTKLRRRVSAGGMLSFLQLAGMPCSKSEAICEDPLTPDLFAIDPSATRQLDGRWYPLSVPEQVPAMGAALADFAATVQAADAVPTIWALWQEPDHTLSANLGKKESLYAYLGLYRAFAAAVRAADPDSVIAGPQQNQATGTNPDHSLDGAGFNAFVTNRGRGVGEGTAVPLDYVTIQNYLGTVSTLETIQNTRIAYAGARFARAPVMFNEWDRDKSKDNGFTEGYDTAPALIDFLDQVAVMMDAPDLVAALLPRAVWSSSPVVLAPMELLGKLSPHRRPLAASGPGAADLAGLAAGDADGLGALVWNHATEPRTFTLDLHALPAGLAGGELTIRTLTKDVAPVVTTVRLAAGDVSPTGIVIPPQGVALVSAGAAEPTTSGLPAALYARHTALCPRRGGADAGAPHGMGYFDLRSGTLVTTVDGPEGTGLAGVVLHGIAPDATLGVRVVASGLPASAAESVLAVRVDYLAGDDSAKAVLYRDRRFAGAVPAASLVVGVAPAPTVRDAAFDSGAVTLSLGADAPAGWASGPRRALVSLVVGGAAGPATVTARLASAP